MSSRRFILRIPAVRAAVVPAVEEKAPAPVRAVPVVAVMVLARAVLVRVGALLPEARRQPGNSGNGATQFSNAASVVRVRRFRR